MAYREPTESLISPMSSRAQKARIFLTVRGFNSIDILVEQRVGLFSEFCTS